MPSMSREKMIDSRYRPRTNLMADPRATTAGAGGYWRFNIGGAGITSTQVVLSGQAPPFPGGPTTVAQCTVTSAGGTYLDVRTGDVAGFRIPVVAGKTYSLGIWANFSASTPTMTTYVQWVDAAGAILTTVTTSNDGASTANVWRLYKKEALVAPANAVTVQFIVRRGTTIASGEVVQGTAAVCEEGPVLHAYFDGTMRNAGWGGAANASPSHTNGWVGLT